jgi:F-type H+-transporting ATPase subunit b
LKVARAGAKEIVEKAREQAEKSKSEIAAEAKGHAEKIIADAKAEIEREKQKTIAEIKSEIGGLVVAATEKVVGEKMDSEKDKRLIEETLGR